MRKIFFAMIVLVVSLSVNCEAGNRFDDDPNYVFIISGDGKFTYFYAPSVDVQEYNPPHYQIAGQFVSIGLLDEHIRYFKIIMRYNWYTKEIFTRNKDGRWQKTHVKDAADSVLARGNINIANALFRAAYGMNFYSN